MWLSEQAITMDEDDPVMWPADEDDSSTEEDAAQAEAPSDESAAAEEPPRLTKVQKPWTM